MHHSTVPAEVRHSHRFGRFELQPSERRLLDDGVPVTVGARAFDLLVALVERAGQLVGKNELLTRVWAGLVVEENNLQVQVSALRKLLGQSAVATIPGRGYRFELPIEQGGATVSEPRRNDVAAAPSDTPGPAPVPTNLPSQLLSLYGRAQDVAAIKALLREHAVVTVVGAGGIGKTRVAQTAAAELAVEAAADFPDGVWWVELAALSDATLVPSAVARALGAQLSAGRPPRDALVALLASRRLLLVLDNCEHVVDAVAELIEAVRVAAPRVRVLATSQETLKAADEHVYRVGGLAVPPDADPANATRAGAIELFVARARAVDPAFALTSANTPAVVEICRRLDGIPLAIELAAARLPLLGIEGLRTRLDERFNVLTAGARVVLRRHQTLRATLEWSHGLLTPDEQTVFQRLGVFAGGFTLESAQHVVSDDRIDAWGALDHLGALVDKSLVLAEGDPLPRYRLLETTRAYALERLGEAGETQRMLRRHAEATLAFLEAYDRRWRATRVEEADAAAELDNLRAAFGWASSAAEGIDLVVPLAARSALVWFATFHLAEGLDRCLALRDRVHDRTPLREVARFWLAVARIGMYSMRRESYEAGPRAAELFRQLGDDSGRYDALVYTAAQAMRFGSAEDQGRAIAEAARLERPDWPARQRASLPFVRCWHYARLGRAEEALACAQQQVAINRAGGSPVIEQFAMSNVTAMELMLGRTDDALEHARTAIARLEGLGARASRGAGHLYNNAMIALLLLDRQDEAEIAGRSAYTLLLQEGDEYRLLTALALLAALRGRLADAARILGHDDAVHARTGDPVRPDSAPLRARLDPLLAALPVSELERLRAEGAAMSDERAFRLGFGED